MPIIETNAFWKSASEAFANDALELTILPTEKCNLRCTYCYEKFELGKMSPKVIQSVRNLLTRRAPELRSLDISWFGGEPLLAVDVIESIGGHVHSLMEKNPFLLYSGSATTNGVLLTEEIARRLSRAGVKHLHVSLDGPAPAHDKTRVGRKGRGTFATLEKNLTEIRDSDIDMRIDLRIHVTPLNVDLLDDFSDYLIDTYLNDARFNVYFFPLVDLGGPQQGQFKVLSKDAATTVVKRLTAKVHLGREKKKSLRNQNILDSLVVKKSCHSPYVCYAAKPNAWVVRSNGRLSKCTVGFEDERNDVGKLTPEGTFELNESRLQTWMRGWSTGDQLSLHCPYEGIREDVRVGLVESRG